MIMMLVMRLWELIQLQSVCVWFYC